MNKLAILGGEPAVTIPQPHFEWGAPTAAQLKGLKAYTESGGVMSIYGDDGIYRKLETEIENKYQVKYAILTNTGTSSLNSGFFGLGIERGDEVIVPTYTFLATVTPLLRLGASIVFVDADPVTGSISPEDIERKITNKTKAIALTHMWGIPCDMDKIMVIANENNIKVLEDCSHAHFTKYKGKLLGTFGSVACLSIGAKKTWTSGEGGFLVTNDPEVYIRATLLGHFEVRAKEALKRLADEGHMELVKKYEPFISGYGENYRMHPYSAVMAYEFLLNDLPDVIKNRASSLRYFTERLSHISGIIPPVYSEDYYTGAMYGYKPKINMDKLPQGVSFEILLKAIQAENIKIKLPDSMALHTNPIFSQEPNEYSLTGETYSSITIDGEFKGVKEYLSGRVTLPTFSNGVAKDKEVIDQYCDGLQKVFSQVELLSELG